MNSLEFVTCVLILVSTLIVLSLMAWLIVRQEKVRQEQLTFLLNQWNVERSELLSRLMTKEWQSFVQVSASQKQASDETTMAPIEVDPSLGEMILDLNDFAISNG